MATLKIKMYLCENSVLNTKIKFIYGAITGIIQQKRSKK